jgi:hypothetical protein
MKKVEIESQSLLIQRSYSYKEEENGKQKAPDCRNPFLFRGPIPTVCGQEVWERFYRRNPFLFRGPIPTMCNLSQLKACFSRNPFLFRGPIPTPKEKLIKREG